MESVCNAPELSPIPCYQSYLKNDDTINGATCKLDKLYPLNHFIYHLKFSQVSFEGHVKQGNSSPASLNKSMTFFFVCSSNPNSSMRFLKSPVILNPIKNI